jgi:hypothetical protein
VATSTIIGLFLVNLPDLSGYLNRRRHICAITSHANDHTGVRPDQLTLIRMASRSSLLVAVGGILLISSGLMLYPAGLSSISGLLAAALGLLHR